MNKVLKDYKTIKKEQPSLGDYPALAYAIGENPSTSVQEIQEWFDKLVAKDQYRRAEKEELVLYLAHIGRIRGSKK